MRLTYFILTISILLSTGYASAQVNFSSASRIVLEPDYKPFYHGVASGDPLSDRVIIWTRVTPDTNLSQSIPVTWKIATDTNMAQVVNSGTTSTSDTVDYTVKVDASGLQPDTWYYYQFNALGRNSLIGRTKTTPVGDTDSIRFAIVSCAHFEHGYYNAYERITNRNDIDAVIHLGDYIYEYAAGGGYTTDTVREHEPLNEILTLADYRTRYSQYHLDPQLRGLHQQYPFIVVWDDHETANNSWSGGAANHDSTTEGSWTDRKAAGIQAHHEWLPIRLPDPSNEERIYRKFSFGNLVDLLMLDTRLFERDEQVAGQLIANTNAQLNDPSRTLIGNQQYNWMINKMDSSTAQWKLLGQQVMIAPMELNGILTRFVLNTDQWDGYRAERDKLLNDILNKGIDNVVVLTGDIHTSWANDVPLDVSTYDPATGAGSVAVEFVATSVTSSASIFDFLGNFGSVALVKSNNPHIKFVDLASKGYVIVDITKLRTQADWFFVTTVDSVLPEDNYAESWYVNDQERFLNGSTTPSQGPAQLQPQAPLLPPVVVGIENVPDPESVLFGVYPNPFDDKLLVKFYTYQPVNLNISLIDILGKTVLTKKLGTLQKGLHYTNIDAQDVPPGNYIMLVESPNQILKRKIVKN